MTDMVEWGEEAEATAGFVTHPQGYIGTLVASADAETYELDGKVCGIRINGNVDGAKASDYVAHYQDRDTGKWGFALFRVDAPLIAFGIRKHGDKVTPQDLLKIKQGMTARCKLSVEKYGKCGVCGKTFNQQTTGECPECGNPIEERSSNKVDKWLEPKKGTAQRETQRQAPAAEAGNDPIEF